MIMTRYKVECDSCKVTTYTEENNTAKAAEKFLISRGDS